MKDPTQAGPGVPPDLATLFGLATANPLVILNGCVYGQLSLSILFLILGFVVANTANETVPLFASASVFISFPLWSYYVIHRLPTHVTVGASLGAGLLLVFISLQNAMFWGSLSVCQKVNYSIKQYSCNSKVTYRGLCIVSILLVLAHLVFVVLLAQFRLAVLKDLEEYEQIFEEDREASEYVFVPATASSLAAAVAAQQQQQQQHKEQASVDL